MSKFAVNDLVRVIGPVCKIFDQVGTVTVVGRLCSVRLAGRTWHIPEHHLTLADKERAPNE